MTQNAMCQDFENDFDDADVVNQFSMKELDMAAGLDASLELDRVIQAEGHYLKFDEDAFATAVTNLDDFLASFRAATLSPTAGQIAYNFRIGLLSNVHFEGFCRNEVVELSEADLRT